MTGAELVSEVQSIVDDSSFEEDEILNLLNDGLSMAAARVDIPELASVDSVTTLLSSNSVDLPADYMRKVEGVYSLTYARPISKPGATFDYLKFKRRHPVLTMGECVSSLAVRGFELFYHPVPFLPEELQLTYYRKPAEITDGSIPTEIPEHLQRRLLCGYAACQIFNKIEDGIEGAKTNTENNRNEYMAALAELAAMFPTDAEAVYAADDYGW